MSFALSKGVGMLQTTLEQLETKRDRNALIAAYEDVFNLEERVTAHEKRLERVCTAIRENVPSLANHPDLQSCGRNGHVNLTDD